MAAPLRGPGCLYRGRDEAADLRDRPQMSAPPSGRRLPAGPEDAGFPRPGRAICGLKEQGGGAGVRIRFDHGPAGEGAAVFDAPLRLIEAHAPGEVGPALAALDAARAAGHWLAGYLSYEAGFALEPRLLPLMPPTRSLPLLRFGAYAGPAPDGPLPGGPCAIGPLTPCRDAAAYASAFARLHDWIGAGDIYQANLTFPMQAETQGSPRALYAALAARQPVGHGALVEQDGLPALLCRSPELFFRTDTGGRIETRPMKGTLPRGATPEEDAALRDSLAADPKNRAENLMIVDLLRNDLSRVAAPGSVHVPALFQVESYRTVHQMVSRIAARLRPGAGLADIFRALFPCGSITGAPKLRAMEILRELEPWPRGIYCGTIGWAAPDGRAEFSVAIRTLTVGDGRAVLNVGGGIVWDSTAPAEYEEALWKSRFACLSPPEPG